MAAVWRSRYARRFTLRFALSLIFICNSIHAIDAPVEPTWIPGYLIIHGGSDLPAPMVETFVKLAGGTGAKIVFVQAASQDVGADDKLIEPFQTQGAASVKVLRL